MRKGEVLISNMWGIPTPTKGWYASPAWAVVTLRQPGSSRNTQAAVIHRPTGLIAKRYYAKRGTRTLKAATALARYLAARMPQDFGLNWKFGEVPDDAIQKLRDLYQEMRRIDNAR